MFKYKQLIIVAIALFAGVFATAYKAFQQTEMPDQIVVKLGVTGNDGPLTEVWVNFAVIAVDEHNIPQQEALDYADCYIDDIMKSCQVTLNTPEEALQEGQHFAVIVSVPQHNIYIGHLTPERLTENDVYNMALLALTDSGFYDPRYDVLPEDHSGGEDTDWDVAERPANIIQSAYKTEYAAPTVTPTPPTDEKDAARMRKVYAYITAGVVLAVIVFEIIYVAKNKKRRS